MARADASGSVEIAAPAETVYDLITDLAVLTQLADETARMRWTSGSTARPGAVFRGTNRNGWHRWSTTCTVTEAEAGRRFAFEVKYAVVPISRWTYEIEGIDGGCRVTESTTDMRPVAFDLLGGLATGVRDRASANAAHIRATLQRLKVRAETTAAA